MSASLPSLHWTSPFLRMRGCKSDDSGGALLYDGTPIQHFVMYVFVGASESTPSRLCSHDSTTLSTLAHAETQNHILLHSHRELDSIVPRPRPH